jgi:anhydro-N-acetylmuramic acid kinase
VDALRTSAVDARALLVCGGGVHNGTLMAGLMTALAPLPVTSTSVEGLDPDFVEAALFAWLARERLAGRPGNLPGVSGARGPRVLGAIHSAPR